MAVESGGGGGGISAELKSFLSGLLGAFYLGSSSSLFADLVRAREAILANDFVEVGGRTFSRTMALDRLFSLAESSSGVDEGVVENVRAGGNTQAAGGWEAYRSARDIFRNQAGDLSQFATGGGGGTGTTSTPTSGSGGEPEPGVNDLRAQQPIGGGGGGTATTDVSALGTGLLRQGSRGDSVRALQQMLADKGYNVGPIDGIYGSMTAAAVRAFQQDAGISVDGIVGPQTRSALSGGTTSSGSGTPTGAASGGGAGGGGATGETGGGGGGARNPVDVPDAQLEETVRRLYGYLAVFMDHPELGPIIKQAAKEGWSQERIKGAVSKTQWWQSTSQTAREWEVLKSEDPATAEQRLNTRIEQLQEAATRFGAPVSDEIVRGLAETSIRLGWNEDQIDEALLVEAQKTGDAFGPGQITFTAEQLRAAAGDYFVPLSEQAAQDWALKIARNETTTDAFQSYLREQAASMFSGNQSIQKALQSGLTVRQWADPYVQIAADTLELNPRDVDFGKPKFRRMIHEVTDEGGTPMSLAEAQRYLRSLPDWQGTRQATEQAAELTENLARKMGVA